MDEAEASDNDAIARKVVDLLRHKEEERQAAAVTEWMNIFGSLVVLICVATCVTYLAYLLFLHYQLRIEDYLMLGPAVLVLVVVIPVLYIMKRRDG